MFVVLALRWGNERGLWRGTYFSSTKAASRAMGFWTDRVGRLLRKNRDTRSEGYARFPEVFFVSAKAAMKWRHWHFEVWLRKEFPWAFENELEIYNHVLGLDGTLLLAGPITATDVQDIAS